LSIPLNIRVPVGDTDNEFTVDNGLIDVPVTSTGGGSDIFSFNDQIEKTWFIAGENFLLKGYGIMCPHAYVLSQPIVMALIADTNPTVQSTFVLNGLTVPFLNATIEINQRISLQVAQTVPSGLVERCTLLAVLDIIGRVSQLNSPDIMNTEVVPLYPYLVIESNFPLEQNPV